MTERLYETEDVLQALLAEHPEVLAGGDEGREHEGWVLVRREAGVADAADSSSRWSLDHLYLDAGGVPTLVELKRSTDTRSRREVVAQMLDYAANATAFWKVDLLQARFEIECERQGTDGAAALGRVFEVSDRMSIGPKSRRIWRLIGSGWYSSRTRSLQSSAASWSS